MFIHRTEKEHPEVGLSPEGHLIISKNRNGPTGQVELYFNETIASYSSVAHHYDNKV